MRPWMRSVVTLLRELSSRISDRSDCRADLTTDELNMVNELLDKSSEVIDDLENADGWMPEFFNEVLPR